MIDVPSIAVGEFKFDYFGREKNDRGGYNNEFYGEFKLFGVYEFCTIPLLGNLAVLKFQLLPPIVVDDGILRLTS